MGKRGPLGRSDMQVQESEFHALMANEHLKEARETIKGIGVYSLGVKVAIVLGHAMVNALLAVAAAVREHMYMEVMRDDAGTDGADTSNRLEIRKVIASKVRKGRGGAQGSTDEPGSGGDPGPCD